MDIGKKAVLEEEWIPNFLEDKKIKLECKCGNNSVFHYRQTEGATIYPNDDCRVHGGFEEVVIECTYCGCSGVRDTRNGRFRYFVIVQVESDLIQVTDFDCITDHSNGNSEPDIIQFEVGQIGFRVPR